MTAPRIGIVGAGAFGTALAIALAREGRAVTLWSRGATQAAMLREERKNSAYLPGVDIPENVTVTAKLKEMTEQDVILLSIPMQGLRAFLTANDGAFAGVPLVACCKGVDLATLSGPSATLQLLAPDSPGAILTGPSFAADIARGLPTALTLACREDLVGPHLQQLLSTTTLRLYLTDDVIGAELGGALKNVIAIAAGITIGAELGESARAALMTRGYAEMVRLATTLGARAETLAGLSGFGDLVLTCTSPQSRNFRYGMALGSGTGFDPHITVEGAATAKAVSNLAKERDLDLPITQMVAALIDGTLNLSAVIQTLLSRPLKKE